MSRKYVIINTSEINTVDFTQVLQTSEKKCRYGPPIWVLIWDACCSCFDGMFEHAL